MRKGNAKRIMSGFLATLTVLSTMMQPVTSFAAEVPSDGTVPLYKDVADMLDADEVVVAHDHEVSVGSTFDIEVDFSGIEIPGNDKVKVKFQKAMNDEGESFTTDHEDSYEAVYYVEPQKTDHPTYQISRTITVKEEKKASSETVAEASSQTTTENDSGGGITEETTEDDDSDSESSVVPDDVEQITDEAFDAEIESTENQETVDPETGTSLSEVLEEAVEQDVNLAELEVGETVTFEMPMLFAATGSQSVSITRGSWYHYADYGLGSYITAPYYVTWGGIKATAYCVQPSKTGPDDGTYSITKLSDGKTLAKVCYYGTKASDENGFFDEKHPDFSTGKRFIITHIAAAYANGSSDWDSGTNATGRSLAKELYNYCVSMPDIPDVDMSFSDDNVKAYVEGNVQRTKTITFKADTLQTITFKLPAGVKLVNVSTGKTSAAGASVEISGGTQFYLQAPLTQAEDVKATFSATMKGSIDKEYSAYKISTGSGTQDLALVFGEGVGNEKYVDFKVTWTKECYHIAVSMDDDAGIASTMVNNHLMNMYGITQEQLHEDAMKSSPILFPATVASMGEVMKRIMMADMKEAGMDQEMMDAMIQDMPMVEDSIMTVITNVQGINGAAAIFYPDQMDKIAERLGGDYFILPSSVHETLVVPDDGKMSFLELRSMVTEINATMVNPSERLTDEVYHYDSKDKLFEKAATFDARQKAKTKQQEKDVSNKDQSLGNAVKTPKKHKSNDMSL